MNKISLIEQVALVRSSLQYFKKNIGDVVLVDVIQGLAEGKCLDLGKAFQLIK